jgi:glycosyltransferase involved in cell wall biosynthesis
LYPNVRTEVIHCPVAAPEKLTSATERVIKRAELKTPQDAVVIIQVSRMESWKGQALHLEALSTLKDVPRWVCWQVGGAQQREEFELLERLKQTAARLGIADRVRFLGHRSDVSTLLAAADIYCQPNYEPEPFGIAFIEALQAKLPVVTTAFGGACEIVDKSCGLLINRQDAQALAQSLLSLIEDGNLRASLGAKGPDRARELCDPARQIERLGQLLASAAPRSSFSTIQQEVELA